MTMSDGDLLIQTQVKQRRTEPDRETGWPPAAKVYRIELMVTDEAALRTGREVFEHIAEQRARSVAEELKTALMEFWEAMNG